MDRRKAIAHLVVLSAATAIWPSCRQQESSTLKFKNFSLDASDEKMMASLAQAILPIPNPADAAALAPHAFTLMMIDDCYDPARQKQFTSGMKDFDRAVQDKYGHSFAECSPNEQKEWLGIMERKSGTAENLRFFYQTTRSHTVQALMSSRSYMTNVQHYKLVPGSKFKGCVPVNA